jgi:ATP-binding cassette, subfamily G (WHITE), member 1
MFFDEPSSGLDSVSTTKCLSLLKKLSASGKIIICTIHQPSALIFETFDHIYAIAEGQCIYQGSHDNLAPFLSSVDLNCPEFHNIADFLLEISTHDYGYQMDKLVKKIDNGKNQQYFKCTSFVESKSNNQLISITKRENNPFSVCVKRAQLNIFDPSSYCNKSDLYATSFIRQFYYLYKRTFLLIMRNPSLSLSRLLIHIFVGIFIGLIYFQSGYSAKNLMNNFKYIFYTVMFLMFTAFSSLQTTCK